MHPRAGPLAWIAALGHRTAPRCPSARRSATFGTAARGWAAAGGRVCRDRMPPGRALCRATCSVGRWVWPGKGGRVRRRCLQPGADKPTRRWTGFGGGTRHHFTIHADRAGQLAARLGAGRRGHPVGGRARRAGRAIRYRGRIDDQYTRGDAAAPNPGVATYRGIEALLAGRTIDQPETEAIGCPIDQPRLGPTRASTLPILRSPRPITTKRMLPRSCGGGVACCIARVRSPRLP